MKILIISAIALVLTLSVTPAMAQEQENEGSIAEPGPQPEGYVGERVATATTCGTLVNLATTNGVPITIRQPINTGACTWTLECRARGGSASTGSRLTLAPGGRVHSFSCGPVATNIFWDTTGTGQAVIDYIP
jgi:hypothetical protein